MGIKTIIGLLIILIIVVAIIAGILYIQWKLKNVSQEVFGTRDLKKAADMIHQDEITRHKSVAALTSLMLPKIMRDFPDFQYNEMKERAENVLVSYLQGITEQKTGILKDANNVLKVQLENKIRMLQGQGLKEHFENIKLHRTEIREYHKEKGKCIVTFESSLECYHYIENDEGIQSGSNSEHYQTKFDVDVIYIQDPFLAETDKDGVWSTNCPNCGAPITTLGIKKCLYCGTAIQEINVHAWSFSDVREVQ